MRRGRVQRQRILHRRPGLGNPAQAVSGLGEIKQNQRVIGLFFDGFLQQADGQFIISRPVGQPPQSVGNFRIIGCQLVGGLGHFIGFFHVLRRIQAREAVDGGQMIGNRLQNTFVGGNGLVKISGALANGGQPSERNRVIRFFGDPFFQQRLRRRIGGRRIDGQQRQGARAFLVAGESFADLQRALQRRARRRLFIQHVIRHAQMKLNLRLIRQLRRSFFQQAQRHGISAALQTDPAQRVRRGGIERQQFTRVLGQFVGAVNLAQIFGIQIRQVVEGRTELWIYQQNFLIRRRRARVILVRAMNGGGQHQRRDGLRGKRDGRVQFGQRLLVFPGIEIHLRQQPISARIFWLQLNGFQQRGFGLDGIALRHKNFGDQQI